MIVEREREREREREKKRERKREREKERETEKEREGAESGAEIYQQYLSAGKGCRRTKERGGEGQMRRVARAGKEGGFRRRAGRALSRCRVPDWVGARRAKPLAPPPGSHPRHKRPRGRQTAAPRERHEQRNK